MPHTLEASQSLSGTGEWIQEVDRLDQIFITVTTRGDLVVEMDVDTPARLFQAGWIALGHQRPDSGNPIHYEEPIWIVFDLQVLNVYSKDIGLVGDLGINSIRYHLIGGTEIDVDIYSYS